MGVKGLKTYLLNKKRINNPEVIPTGSKLLIDALGFAFQGIIYNIAIIIIIIINIYNILYHLLLIIMILSLKHIMIL